MPRHRVFLSAVIFFLAVAASPSALPAALPAASAQYFDGFDGPAAALDPRAWNGWAFYAGDGTVLMDFRQDHGLASVFVDATQDRNNVWWALIRRRVSQALDLTQLADPYYQLRVEARIKTNRAPRRINLHLNTQKTTDFHSHLMEYDIADTSEWHVLSMTTRGFEAYPGDSVYVQLALMDWGLERYRVDVDYVRVDVVDTLASGADLGCPIPYHPKPASPVTFVHHVTVEHDAVIDLQYQDMNFDGWVIREPEGDIPLLSAGGTHYAIMRWNLSGFAGKRVVGSGLLELTTHSVMRSPAFQKDFGMVRIVEILGGEPFWNQKNVTCRSIGKGKSVQDILNSQMIVDVDAAEGRGKANWITIPNPVLQRMVDARTFGIAIKPLGAVYVSFYALEYRGGKHAARLHFNTAEGK